MTFVKEFYYNMVDTSSKRLEVIVRGKKVQYYEPTINLMLGVKNVRDTYQRLLETINEKDLDVLYESLCNPYTKWMETNKSSNKIMLRIDLHPEPKVWYRFIKHSLKPTTHNGTSNKAHYV